MAHKKRYGLCHRLSAVRRCFPRRRAGAFPYVQKLVRERDIGEIRMDAEYSEKEGAVEGYFATAEENSTSGR